MKNFSVKTFPWSPGIPWKVKRGKYIIPELPIDLLHHLLQGKPLVVCAFGGLLESFYSLSILESLNKNFPRNKLFWAGNSEYYSLVKANGLAKIFEGVTEEDTQRFPTPIFLDKNNRAYFNCLHNYLLRKPYYSSRGYPDDRAAIQQIVENSTMAWDEQYLPDLRYPEEFGDLNDFFRSRGIDLDRKNILLMPDETEASQHGCELLSWNDYQVKSFITMANQLGYQTLLLTSRSQSYWGVHAKVISFSVNMFFSLIRKVRFLAAQEVDFPLISLGYSEAKIIANQTDGAFKLSKNSRVVGSSSVIYTEEEFLPSSAFELIRETE